MEEKRSVSRSIDLPRYGERLWDYLLGMGQITETLYREGMEGLSHEAKVDSLLREILPAMCVAFNSETAFVADDTGKIFFTHPQDSILVGKDLADTRRGRILIEESKPLVAYEVGDEHPREMHTLGVRSLLVAPLETLWGRWFLGVCNGKNEPEPYLAEDVLFLAELLKILTIGSRYGESEEERRVVSDRYVWARLRGEWEYLSRASEDHARARVGLQRAAVDRPCHGLFDKAHPDNLLADYLDAELCRVVRLHSTTSTDEQEQVPKTLLELCQVTEYQEGQYVRLSVKLRDNGPWTEQLKPNEYPRTALAMARICLWAGYLKAGAKVPYQHKSEASQENESKKEDRAHIDKLRRKPRRGKVHRCLATIRRIFERKTTKRMYKRSDTALLPQDLRVPEDKSGQEVPTQDLDSVELFWILPNWLLQEARPTEMFAQDLRSLEWQVDWIRTLWQKIHYLARDGMVEPRRDWIEQIDNIYADTDAWPLTVWALQSYLKDQASERDLFVDSDWLIIWLTSNVLLSKRLGKHYGLIPLGGNGRTDTVSPTTKMRYFVYLSQQTLYALHCVRHDRRRRVFDECKQRSHFQRPPFADVPLGLTSSLSEAQLYVLSEYAYREIGVHRELRIFERLTRQLYYQLPLYAAHGFYRDHLYHVMDVCLIGELLLRSMLRSNDDDILVHILAETLVGHAENDLTDQLLRNWYVAALCHDLGYVIEQAEKLVQPIGEINGKGLDDFAEKIRKGLGKGKKAIRQAIAQTSQLESPVTPGISAEELLKVVEPTDHGAVSWLHLHQWLEEVQDPPKSLAPALTAILRHNLPEQKVNVRKDPLSLLLILCDHIQEWGRPRVGPVPLAQGIMEALRFAEQPEFERKIRVRRLVVHGLKPVDLKRKEVSQRTCESCAYSLNCTGRCFRVHTRIEESGLEFKLPHVESREGDFEPGISWLLFCRDLQCLASRDGMLPFPITIILKHAPPRIWSVLPWKPLEMDLLEEFANTHKAAVYLCEWIEFARRGEKGVQYKKDQETGEETFIIKLHELDCPLQRGLSDKHWRDFFRWKWQWLGHKFITLSLGTWFPEL